MKIKCGKIVIPIYIVLEEFVYNGESDTVIIFSSFDRNAAYSVFNERVRNAKEYDHLSDASDKVEEESAGNYTIYRDGRYSEDHLNISVDVHEVEVCKAIDEQTGIHAFLPGIEGGEE